MVPVKGHDQAFEVRSRRTDYEDVEYLMRAAKDIKLSRTYPLRESGLEPLLVDSPRRRPHYLQHIVWHLLGSSQTRYPTTETG